MNSFKYSQEINDSHTRSQEVPKCEIRKIEFSMYDDKNTISISKCSFPQTINKKLSSSVESGFMGTLDDATTCSTCSKHDCPQHLGHIDFGDKQIYNPISIALCATIMKVMCENCGEILGNQVIPQTIKGIKRLKMLAKNVKTNSICINCNNQSQYVNYRTKKLEKQKGIIVGIKEDKSEEEIPASKFYDIFIQALTYDDSDLNRKREVMRRLDLLGLKDVQAFVKSTILVPPKSTRPQYVFDGNKKMNAITVSLVSITNKVIAQMSQKTKQNDIYPACHNLIFGNKDTTKKIAQGDGILPKVQEKEGYLRNKASSKRVDQTVRTVAGGNPALPFGFVSLPMDAMRNLTKDETVNKLNINELRKLVKKGGALMIVLKNGMKKKCDKKINQTHNLQIGEIVKRFLKDGDIVCVNRQPTLHRQSMMQYRAIGWNNMTIGIHLSTTKSMNADFDGDEITAQICQTPEVDAETSILMSAKNNAINSENSRPIVSFVMNSLTAGYILSDPNLKIDPELYEIILKMTLKTENESFQQKLDKYKVNRYSGRGLLSFLFPEDFFYNYQSVLIVEGILISGRLKKKHLGDSSRSIMQELWKKYNPEIYSDFITNFSWAMNRYLIDNPLSISIADCYTEDDKVKNIIEEEFKKLEESLESLGGKKKDPVEEDMRQRKIIECTSINTIIGVKIAKDVFSGTNAIGIITDNGAGTKGTALNVCQIVACVGQQFHRGSRLKQNLSKGTRILPFYDYNGISAEENGFVKASFFQGMTTANLFCIQYAGREGIIDTALETADSGYLQRNMIKSQECLMVDHDGKVKNTFGYEFSGLYPYNTTELMMVRRGNKPLLLPFDISSKIEEINLIKGWKSKNIKTDITSIINQDNIFKNKSTILNPQKFNRFEKSRIVSARATQIANGSEPLFQTKITNSLEIASEEYNRGLLVNFFVLRRTPNGLKKVYATFENIY